MGAKRDVRWDCRVGGIAMLAALSGLMVERNAAAYHGVPRWSAEDIPAERSVDPASEQAPARPADGICSHLLEAIVQVESAGNSRCVGRGGERGLMQIKQATWREVTRKLYGTPLCFSRAFDPAVNKRVGEAYLEDMLTFLRGHRMAWQADERSLLLACYNAGPTRVRTSGFELNRLSASTQDYVQRVSALHDEYRSNVTLVLRRPGT